MVKPEKVFEKIALLRQIERSISHARFWLVKLGLPKSDVAAFLSRFVTHGENSYVRRPGVIQPRVLLAEGCPLPDTACVEESFCQHFLGLHDDTVMCSLVEPIGLGKGEA